MTSYEVVRRAIEFQRPDRLPMVSLAPERNDVFAFGWNQIGSGDPNLPTSVDEWGSVWVRTSSIDMGQVKGHPLADWSALARYRWPDADNPAFYEGMEERLARAGDKYVRTGISMLLFERMQTLRGMENTLLDLYLERERAEMLADRIVEFDLRIIENISRRFPSGIHGFLSGDDWGHQKGLFVKPQVWDEFFKPRYKRIFDAVHKAGWHVWLHSCGKINEAVERLIGLGLDVLNAQQPRLMGIEEIGRMARGRVCFLSECDIQMTLPFATPDEIREEARLILEHWATPDGGFIFKDYTGGEAALAAPRENTEAMLNAFLAFAPWGRKSRNEGEA